MGAPGQGLIPKRFFSHQHAQKLWMFGHGFVMLLDSLLFAILKAVILDLHTFSFKFKNTVIP